MSVENDRPAWFLGFSELERTLEEIREKNAEGLMQDYDTQTPLLRPKENLVRLHWYRELELQLARLVSGWIATASAFRLKMDLGRQAWLFTEVIETLDARLAELPGRGDAVDPEGRLGELRRRLARARNEEQFLVGVYHVVQSQLLMTITAHIRQCDPLADWPTRDRLERVGEIIRGQIAWAQEYTSSYLASADSAEVATWCEYASALLAAAGGTRGEAGGAWPAHPFEGEELLDACAEPSRLEPGWNVTDEFMMAAPRVTEGALSDVLFHNFAELIVPEGLGYMIFDLDGMPYGFYRMFIRQIWDECRHTEMGVRELKRLGVDIGKLPMNRLTRPPTYTEMLCIIGFTGEACSFPRKFQSVKGFYKNSHFEAGLVTEYDIVDEHEHVRNIRRWLPELHKHENIDRPLEEVIKQVQSDALERWATTRKDVVKDTSRATQTVGRFGAFCREVDFELNYDRVFSAKG